MIRNIQISQGNVIGRRTYAASGRTSAPLKGAASSGQTPIAVSLGTSGAADRRLSLAPGMAICRALAGSLSAFGGACGGSDAGGGAGASYAIGMVPLRAAQIAADTDGVTSRSVTGVVSRLPEAKTPTKQGACARADRPTSLSAPRRRGESSTYDGGR